LKPTGLAILCEIRELTGTGPGFDCQEAAGQVFGMVWYQTQRFFWLKPALLAGYMDRLQSDW
jgi:hypothetical protein